MSSSRVPEAQRGDPSVWRVDERLLEAADRRIEQSGVGEVGAGEVARTQGVRDRREHGPEVAEHRAGHARHPRLGVDREEDLADQQGDTTAHQRVEEAVEHDPVGGRAKVTARIAEIAAWLTSSVPRPAPPRWPWPARR